MDDFYEVLFGSFIAYNSDLRDNWLRTIQEESHQSHGSCTRRIPNERDKITKRHRFEM